MDFCQVGRATTKSLEKEALPRATRSQGAFRWGGHTAYGRDTPKISSLTPHDGFYLDVRFNV